MAGIFVAIPLEKSQFRKKYVHFFQNKAAAYDWVNAIVDGMHIHEFNNADTWTSRI